MAARTRSSRASEVAKKPHRPRRSTAPRRALVVRVLVELAKHRGPGSRPSVGIAGRVVTGISQSRERDTDQHAGRTPRRGCRESLRSQARSRTAEPDIRRISGTSIMPITTASMISAPSTALGRSENTGQEQQGQQHGDPGGHRGQTGAGAGVVVQRAGREAGRHRHALEHPHTDVGGPLGDGLLVEVDLVAVLGRKGRGAPAVCEKPMRTIATARRRHWPRGPRGEPGPVRRRPAGHGNVTHQRHAALTEVEQPGRQEPADHQHEWPGPPARRPGARRPRAAAPTAKVQAGSRRGCPARNGAPGRSCCPNVGPGDLGQLTDHDVDRRPEQEAGDHGLREEPRHPAHPQDGQQDEQQAGDQCEPATYVATSVSPLIPVATTVGRPQPGRNSGPSRSGGRCRRGRRGSPRPPQRTDRAPGVAGDPGYPRFFGTIRAATATPAIRSPRSQRWS